MTDDEKRHQMGQLLLEHQEAEKDLAHLRTKASKLVEHLDKIRDWLNSASRGNSDEKSRFVDGNIRTNFATYRETLNGDAILSLVDEIHNASSKVAQLAQQKQSLGLK